MNILDGLNESQREAVLHTDGPLLLLAGAGSGKTRALTFRIARLIKECGVPPSRILAVTFTNKAADEMRARLEKLVGQASRDIWARTFHATCAQILRWEIEALDGYTRSFTIFDTSDQVALMKRVLLRHQIDDKKFDARAILGAISREKNEMKGPRAVANAATNYFERQIAEVYETYQKQLVENNAVDFDDLILLTTRLFEEHPTVLEKYQERFRYIHIDEYQDTNHSQYALTRTLAAKYRDICVVGDDDQSIYSWRGADIRNILDFERDYPKTTVIHLEQNYRCTQNILAAAQEVVRFNRRRRPKELFTENPEGSLIRYFEAFDEGAEAEFVVETIQERKKEDRANYSDVAVFYRINAMSRSFEDALRRRNIPYQIIGSVRFYERAEIKDVLAYLRLLVNPRDTMSLLRVINTPPRGIGKTTLERVQAFAEANYIGLLEAVERSDEIETLGAAATRNLRKFLAMLRQIRIDGSLPQIIDDLLDKTGYVTSLKERGRIEDEARIENLNELISAAAEFEDRADDASLAAFLESITLASDQDKLEDETDMVTLMTLHSAKGLEYPIVFMAGMEEGMCPHQRSLNKESELEEERRLCYVGMTRAMRDLYLTRARVRRVHGYAQETLRSRFFDEMPQYLIEQLDSWEEPSYYGGGSGAHSWSRPSSAFKRFERSASPSSTARPKPTPKTSKPRRSVSTFDAEPQTADASGFLRVNSRVSHAKFGEGQIKQIDGRGENMRIVVDFDDGGEKSLLAAFANLEPA